MSLITQFEVYNSDDAVKGRFFERARELGWDWYVADEWPAASADGADVLAAAGWDVRAVSATPRFGSATTFAEAADHVVLVTVWRGMADVAVAGESRAAADKARSALVELFPAAERSDTKVEVAFCAWHNTIRRRARSVRVPCWDEIRENYPAAVGEGFEALRDHELLDGGKLALWHGPPGTGKTFAIRALMHAWRDDVNFVFVLDPEQFFGAGVEYMMELVLDEEATAERRLVVIEDAAELLSLDAREKVGHALGRLLNLCDGLLGQGLELVILITTNEPVGKLHPALTRPGRCVSQIEFGPLDREEAARWLDARGAPAASGPRTLAELYAALRGEAEPTPASRVGF